MLSAIGSPPVYLSLAGVIHYHPPVLTRNSEPDERVLADRLKGRDELALSDVYDLYSRPVFSFLNRFTGDRSTAEDIQQQVFLEVWQKASSFNPERGNMLTWIMTIARSRALDNSRRRVPEPRDPSVAATMYDNSGPLESDIEKAIDDWQFSQIVSTLPEDEAEILRHRFHGGLSQSEISHRTGVPLGTVKTRMVNALERLRSQMEVV